MTKQLSPIRFAIHGDIHGFHRIPKQVLERFIFDATKAGCQFICLLGDSSDGGYPIVMSLSNSSPIALFYQHGDHEFFGEWSIGGCSRNYKARRTIGVDTDPLIMAMGGIPRCEAWDGLPRFWSMTYRGIHFVFAFNGKHEVWTPWFLSWLKKDLEENSDFTTVIFSHRGLDEDIGMKGSSVEAARKLLLRFPQVELFCCAHIHRWGLWLLGKLIDVRGEANFQEGWYVLVELAGDAIRIFHRNAETGEMLLRFYRPLSTTLTDDTSCTLSLPFLMSDKSVVYSPAVWLHNAKLRIWGFEMEQLIPDPFFQRGISWTGMNGAEVAEVEVGKQVAEIVELERMAKIKVASASGTEKNPVKICHIASLPILFDESESGESGSYKGGTVYDLLVISKLPKGRRLRLLLETYTEDGEIEASHFVDGIGGDGITAILAKVGMIYIPGVPFRWMGLDGKGEVDGIPTARRATKLEVYLATPEEVEEAEYLAAAFAYPHEGFYTLVDFGKRVSEDVIVTVGGSSFKAERLSLGEFRQFSLDNVAGGEEIRLECGGSKLAIVELFGEADGLMHHLVRKVEKTGEGRFELGKLTEKSHQLLQIAEFNQHVGVTALTMFKEAKINDAHVKPLKITTISPSKPASINLI